MLLQLWSEESSREFLSAHYPWFLNTYDGYPHPVQRVDVVKYFLMLHYGGIYLDMDNVRGLSPANPAVRIPVFTITNNISSQGCSTDLTPVLYYPTWTTDGGRGALSNNVLGSVPNHPFWKMLTDSLIPYSYNFLFPYVTISYASGQWFETAIWDAYHADLPADSDTENRLYRIMMDDRPGSAPWVYFTQTTYGGTWNSWDNKMFLWIGDHLILLGVVVGGIVALVCWSAVRILKRRRRKMSHSESYLPVVQDEEDADLQSMELIARSKAG